ncbi:MAG: hypothetical protein KGH72_04615 [Candidatus Micrarchaeota archaeon]|nr:hypothetical protein [Candidatus Micrarchaeota archaeon]
MAKTKKSELSRNDIREPSIIVKPIARLGGLDNIHMALLVLVVILILLLLFVSYTARTPPPSNTTSGLNCTYGAVNGSCVNPIHNASQIRHDVEMLLANYGAINGSVSVLPYTSNVAAMSISYLPSSGSWYVSVPLSVQSSKPVYFSVLVNDRDTSQMVPFIQTVKPGSINSNYVVSDGVIRIANQTSCGTEKPLNVYWFVDPYAPGGISTLNNLTSLESHFGSNVNFSVKILFTQYYQQTAQQYGANKTQVLDAYLFCASRQGNGKFSSFVSNLDSIYTNAYVAPAVLANVSINAGLNASSMNSCLSNFALVSTAQIEQAKYYGIPSSPAVLTDCQYLSIPQTARQAICYANSTLC